MNTKLINRLPNHLRTSIKRVQNDVEKFEFAASTSGEITKEQYSIWRQLLVSAALKSKVCIP